MYRLRQLIVAIGDLTALYLGLYFAVAIRNWQWSSERVQPLLKPMGLLFMAAIVVLFIAGAYDITRAKNSRHFFQKIAISACLWAALGVAYFYIQPQNYITPKTILALTAACGFGLVALWRCFHNKYLSNVLPKTYVVFAGLTAEAGELIKTISRQPAAGHVVLGVIERAPDPALLADIAPLPVTTTLEEIKSRTGLSPHLIIISPALSKDETALKELYQHLYKQVEMADLAKFYEEIMGRIPPFTFSESWFLTNLREQQKKAYDRWRILMDYIFGLAAFIVFAITLPLIALAVKLASRGPVFFAQERVGRNEKIFRIIKYRTMTALNPDGSAETEGPQWAARKDSRVTAVGKILRRAHLDELPQCLNILRGEMSVIGPRPERPEFVTQLAARVPYYHLRHLVKPGVTGWAQLQSDYYGTMEENLRKLEYDLFYIKNRGPILDISIILRTINLLTRLAGR